MEKQNKIILIVKIIAILLIIILLTLYYFNKISTNKNKNKKQGINISLDNNKEKIKKKNNEEKIKNIYKKAQETLKWLKCFYNEDNNSLLGEMTFAGKIGTPENMLKEYIEYSYPRIKTLCNIKNKNSIILNELLNNKRLDELETKIQKKYKYFLQICPDINKIKEPYKKILTKKEKIKIKTYAFIGFQKIKKFREYLKTLNNK